MTNASARFVGIGVDHYASEELPDLQWPAADVRRVHELLRDYYQGDPLVDPTEREVDAHLRAIAKEDVRGGTVIAVWSGHGVPPPRGSGLRLLVVDSTQGRARAGYSPGDVLAACVDTGASQILLIVDTCYAGAALVDIADAAADLEGLSDDAIAGRWIGVLAACSPLVTADDGVFADQLCRVLEHGPATRAGYHQAWSVRNRLVTGHAVCQAVLEEWPSRIEPTPRYRSDTTGKSFGMVPNPLWRPDAPAVVVEHLLLAARGGADPAERSWFTGRILEVNEVVSWVTGQAPGLRVVTGSAGTGKSTILGRVVSASVPSERARLLVQHPDLGHADPGQGSVTAHAHARGVTMNQLAGALNIELERAGVLERSETGTRNGNELLGAVERAAHNGSEAWRAPVVAVDGLDEAGENAFPIATDLLVRLARWCTVIVSTRNRAAVTDTDLNLLDVLSNRNNRLDLDASAVAARSRAAIGEYIRERLLGVSPIMDPTTVADHFLDETDPVVGQPFLIARLMTDQLRAAPVGTGALGWQTRVSTSVGQAFLSDLATVAPPAHRDVTNPQAYARDLLVALTWGSGAGLPEAEWAEIAAVTTGVRLNEDDIRWVLHNLGRYVVEDGEGGVAVYRMAHQSLADRLRPPYRATVQAPFDPQAVSVAAAILGRYRILLSAGLSPRNPRYLWRYAWRHAAAAGPTGLDQFRELMTLAPELRPDGALAATRIGGVLAFYGRHIEAVPFTTESAEMYRTLTADNPSYLPTLVDALNILGVRYGKAGRPWDALTVVEEAVVLARAQAADNPTCLPALAVALANLGNSFSAVGRPWDALTATEEAVQLRRAQAADNPAYLPELAGALGNLGAQYSEIGRPWDALTATEQAVQLRRAQAADNPAYLPELAGALHNLGNAYSAVGRPWDALTFIEEAVELRRAQAADNPAYLPELAGALHNLGNAYSAVGRPWDALTFIEEAVELRRAQAADNPAYLPELAGALGDLAAQHNEVGRPRDALTFIEEAVELRRAQAADNPAYLPDLAMVLGNLGAQYSGVGLRGAAITATEEAVTRFRALVADNPGHLPNLAMALNNLGALHSKVDHFNNALTAAEESLQISRALAADNSAFLPDLAMALTNLGGSYGKVGRLGDAITATEEAAASYRALAADNPAHLPSLSAALNSLGNRYGEVGQLEDAITATEEAVASYRVLAADNPAHLPALAGTLTNLGLRYSDAGWPEDALTCTEEAVVGWRRLAVDDPDFEPDLARALTSLGNRFSDVGLYGDALTLTEEAVELCLKQAADAPGFLPDLAVTLSNLEQQLAEAGASPDRFEQSWTATLNALSDSDNRLALLMWRAASAQAGDIKAVGWLTAARHQILGELGALAAVHDQARRHRAPDHSRFDTEWSLTTGEDPPVWLLVDPDAIALAEGWVSAATYRTEWEWLQSNPEILDPIFDTAVEEAILSVPEDQGIRYRQLRTVAQTSGIDAAYRPLLLQQLAHEFVAADAARQRVLLTDYSDDLRTGPVVDILWALHDRAGDDDADSQSAVVRAQCLIALSVTGTHTAALDAIDSHSTSAFADLLEHTAITGDLDTLFLLSGLAYTTAATDFSALPLLYQAIAHTLRTPPDLVAAANCILRARNDAPGHEPDWITLLARIGAHQSGVLGLIRHLTAPLAEEPTDDD
jgi:tetratricopeptide (TPR) repeat protein